jgi:hypothetical protein
MRLYGSLKELVSAVFRKNSQEITVRPNQSVTYSAARDVQLPQQDADSILVSRNSTDTLTNKSIDADQNTITNIENADIKSAAAIDASKIADGSVSNAEFQRLAGVSSNIQTQLDGKQPLDADLTAVAGLSSNGLIARTGAGTAAVRTVTAGSSKIAISNGDGVSGNPTVDVTEANLSLDNIGGTLSRTKGGTGLSVTTTTQLFNDLDPLTTKGDLISHNGSDSIRVGVGTNGQVLTADSAQASGLSWTSPLTNPMDSAGDMIIGGTGGAATKLDHPGVNNQVVRSTGTSSTGFGQIDAPGFFTTGAAASSTDIGIVTTGTQTMAGHKFFSTSASAQFFGVARNNATLTTNTLVPTTSFMRVTSGATLDRINISTIGTVGNPFVFVINATGASMTINNETGATAQERILTGTGAARTLQNNGMALFAYNDVAERWHLVGF